MIAQGKKMPRKRKPKRAQSEQQELKPRAFVPRPCSMCTALRKPNTNFSRVTTTRGTVRYCECRFCGNTWTQTISADQSTTPVVREAKEVVEKGTKEANAKKHGTRSIIPTDAS